MGSSMPLIMAVILSYRYPCLMLSSHISKYMQFIRFFKELARKIEIIDGHTTLPAPGTARHRLKQAGHQAGCAGFVQTFRIFYDILRANVYERGRQHESNHHMGRRR